VLIFDEPANGLDPRARIEMRDLIAQLRTMGKTVILSSHILTELSDMVTSVVVLEAGRVRAAGPIGAVASLDRQAQPQRVLRMRFLRSGAALDPEVANVLRAVPGVSAIDRSPDGDMRVAYLGDEGVVADVVDAAGTSIAWQPGSDWQSISFQTLYGDGPQRFVAPYPASVIKLMVVVGVARLVADGSTSWHERWTHGGQTRRVADWCEPMITLSSNEATSALVALLHDRGLIRREGPPGADREVHNGLHTLLAQQGLGTLRLANTRPSGGWGNRDGAGVGQLQMTAWDTLRLLWRLQPTPAPWLPDGAAPLLPDSGREQVMAWLAAQQLNQVLSTSSLRHLPDWRAGIAGPFAHKTGTTESYAADAGRVELPDGGHCLIALTSSLGSCCAPHPDAACDWRIAQLGAAVEQWVATARAA